MDDAQLIAMACNAAENAYAPYSHFHVGAALLTANGDVFCGCNVENASYGLTICAERVAICAAVAAGQHEFQAIAIAATNPATPCGACRQFLAEFVPDSFRVIVTARTDPAQQQVYTIAELLPHQFVLKET